MTVDGQHFGLSILSVQDIVETHAITQVPLAPSAISGVMNLRGRIVTVINLRRILGKTDDSESRMGVTVEYKGDLYTILVDQIGEVRLLDQGDFEAVPTTLDPIDVGSDP
jgi:purine-binding chemotaxis protein CheW